MSNVAEKEIRQALFAILRGEGPAEPCPWTEVVAAAASRDLLPTLHYALRPFASSLPGNLREELLLAYRKAQVRKLYAFEQLNKVLRLLWEAGIEFAVLKGAAAAAYYPEPALRPFGDIDLLVRAEALDAAEQVLQASGYLASRPSQWARRRHFHLPPLVPQQDGWNIELHWALTTPGDILPIPAAALWERLAEVEVYGLKLPVLHPVDQLLHLVRHAFVQHRFTLGLRPIIDLAYLIAPWGEKEWAALRARAGNEGWRSCLHLALGLVERIFASGVLPDDVRQWLRPAQEEPFGLEWAEEMLWSMVGVALRGYPSRRETDLPVTVASSWAERGWSAKARRLLSDIFPPPDAMAAIYRVSSPGPRLWLTYLWRPLDLLRRRGPALLQLLAGRPDVRILWNQQMEVEHWLQALKDQEMTP